MTAALPLEAFDLDVCVDCLVYVANAEAPPEGGEEFVKRFEAHSDGFDMFLGDCEEPHFSMQACDGCGSRLGGDRFQAVGVLR